MDYGKIRVKILSMIRQKAVDDTIAKSAPVNKNDIRFTIKFPLQIVHRVQGLILVESSHTNSLQTGSEKMFIVGILNQTLKQQWISRIRQRVGII